MKFLHYLVFKIVICLSHTFDQAPTTPSNVCLPNPPALKATQLAAPFATCGNDAKQALAKKHPDQDLKTPEVLKKYGYPFKTYNITTKDGYILTIYRVTGSPKSSGKQGGKQAVYLSAGLGMASDCWMFQPGSRNLLFKLADAGYEIWIENARGTTYSLGHQKYNSQTDLPYWNFSWHEMGIYDVPAVTDTILKESKNKKIFYIGHSMGTTKYLVSLSELPKMNDKIKAAFLMAPIAYVGHANTGIRLIQPLIDTDVKYQVANVALMGRVNTASQFKQQLKISPGDLCDLSATKCGVCDNILFLLFGYDAPQMNSTELPNIMAKFPNNMGAKVLAHYAQALATCTFKKYDYGPLGNPKAYKSLTAPDYKLQNIKVPTYMYYADKDNLGPPNDVNTTASKFSPGVLKKMYKVNDDLFNHLDFMIAKDADKLLYNEILSDMKKVK